MSDNVWDCVNKEYFTQRPTTDELNMGAQSDLVKWRTSFPLGGPPWFPLCGLNKH